MLSVSCQVVTSFPLQVDLIESIAKVLSSLSYCNSNSNSRVEFTVSHPLLSQLYTSLFASPSSPSIGSISQLNAIGLSCILKSLGQLAVKSSSDIFAQVIASHTLTHTHALTLAHSLNHSLTLTHSLTHMQIYTLYF